MLSCFRDESLKIVKEISIMSFWKYKKVQQKYWYHSELIRTNFPYVKLKNAALNLCFLKYTISLIFLINVFLNYRTNCNKPHRFKLKIITTIFFSKTVANDFQNLSTCFIIFENNRIALSLIIHLLLHTIIY